MNPAKLKVSRSAVGLANLPLNFTSMPESAYDRLMAPEPHKTRVKKTSTDRKFNRMRPSMARVFGLETRSVKAG